MKLGNSPPTSNPGPKIGLSLCFALATIGVLSGGEKNPSGNPVTTPPVAGGKNGDFYSGPEGYQISAVDFLQSGGFFGGGGISPSTFRSLVPSLSEDRPVDNVVPLEELFTRYDTIVNELSDRALAPDRKNTLLEEGVEILAGIISDREVYIIPDPLRIRTTGEYPLETPGNKIIIRPSGILLQTPKGSVGLGYEVRVARPGEKFRSFVFNAPVDLIFFPEKPGNPIPLQELLDALRELAASDKIVINEQNMKKLREIFPKE
ncbi:MAG: hypothetical protein WC753_01775 [Candidatus Gracilibacteria bacterium]